MADLLRCTDYQGREVTLSEQQWNDHVVYVRPYLAGRHDDVRLVLANPDRVNRDAEYATRECYYRRQTLPDRHHHLYFKVVDTISTHRAKRSPCRQRCHCIPHAEHQDLGATEVAITPGARRESHSGIDPTGEAAIHQVAIRVPPYLSFDVDQGELIYDQPSDTLLILPYGRGRDSYAVNVGDYMFSLVDFDTELVGVQIEDFLIRAVKEEPWLIDLLDYADLLGMTVADVRHERQRVLGYGGRFKSWLGRMVRALTGHGEPHPQQAVERLLNRKQFGSIMNTTASA